VPYRFIPWPAPRKLVVRNEPLTTAFVATCTGTFFALVGGLLLPMTNLVPPPPGGEVLMSAMATVFVLAGVAVATLSVRKRHEKTWLALEREELTVTVCSSAGPARRHVVRVDDIERVDVEIDGDTRGATYRTQIVVRGREAIALGDAMTSSRGHYERVAAEIRQFLGWPTY
jgi:hypothetical protein